MPLSIAGFAKPCSFTSGESPYVGPGDHTVSRSPYGAPDGCVTLPMKGDVGSFASAWNAGELLKCENGVSSTSPTGLNGLRPNFAVTVLRGSFLDAELKNATPGCGCDGNL